MNAEAIRLIPRISEKSYGQAAAGTYVFEVPLAVNKQQVAEAVANQFDVKVTDVRIMVQKGKVKRVFRKRQQPKTGKRDDIKKAYVTLADGDSIPVFEEVA